MFAPPILYLHPPLILKKKKKKKTQPLYLLSLGSFLIAFLCAFHLCLPFLVTLYLVVAAQPCVECMWIRIIKNHLFVSYTLQRSDAVDGVRNSYFCQISIGYAKRWFHTSLIYLQSNGRKLICFWRSYL